MHKDRAWVKLKKWLQLRLQMHAQSRIRRLRGKVKWEGDLELWRQGRFPNSRS
jgi:hypothetical protein